MKNYVKTTKKSVHDIKKCKKNVKKKYWFLASLILSGKVKLRIRQTEQNTGR